VDVDRPEVLTDDPSDRRELMVDVWYPAEDDPSAPHAEYMPDADSVAPALANLFFNQFPSFVLDHFGQVKTHAIASAQVAGAQPDYPVLIYMEGAIGYREMNTFQVEELVSHGYIVVAIDQPYLAARVVFPDGRHLDYDKRFDSPHRWPDYDPDTFPAHNDFLYDRVPYLAQDALFALDQLTALNQADPNGILTGRLDLDRAGLFGHSGGSIIGGEACLLAPRLRACLLEDAYQHPDVVRDGLEQPTMFITRDAETIRLERSRSGGWSEATIAETLDTQRAVYESLPGDGYYLQVDGMFHVDMNDIAIASPIATQLGISGPIGGARAHDIVNAYTVAFFDRYLKGKPAPLLDSPSAQFPEVTFEARRP
jgi:platelet-activating factor acetylhydrolase isoform II